MLPGSLQAVTSFVRAVQLGGKGYAPPESDPLRKHVKGLSDYVQFLDDLEEILGEVPDPRYMKPPRHGETPPPLICLFYLPELPKEHVIYRLF